MGEGVMDRRQFLLAVPCSALLAASASAQAPDRLYRIAWLSPSEATIGMMREFQLPELARFGFVEGRNLTVTTHVGPPARIPQLAREAIATKPDVVIAVSTVAILAAKEASSTVPIVMSFIGEDPIEKGVAKSFARPGGSVTGVAMLAAQMDGTRASLLHEFVPAARRIAILTGRPPRHAEGAAEAQRVARELGLETDVFYADVARELGLETDVFYADEPADYIPAFAGMRKARSEALVIISAPDFFRDAALLSRLALEDRLPTVCEWASMAHDGCLLGYGPNFAALWRRPAEYVARILRGEKPGDLPIEQPTLSVRNLLHCGPFTDF
jgi:putative tryptophan/tyrosine transport system substrate-binding protein